MAWHYLDFVGKWAELFDHNRPVQALIETERATNNFRITAL